MLAACGIPGTREVLVKDAAGLEKAAETIGYPLVLKGCSSELAHKTESNLVRLDVRNAAEAVLPQMAADSEPCAKVH